MASQEDLGFQALHGFDGPVASEAFLGIVAVLTVAALSSSQSLSEKNLPRAGGKKRWSIKYKRSIDCKHPKGFSQKNYCARKARGGHYIDRS